MSLTRKEFVKSALGLCLAGPLINQTTFAQPSPPISNGLTPVNGKYSLPSLGYAYDSLEPYIDAKTMEIHHTKHHQAYINKLNEAMDKEPALQKLSLEDLLLNLSKQPETVKGVIRNHGGGHWNHDFFWKSLKTGTTMGEGFSKLSTASFGSKEAFMATFDKLAMGVFGSGWCWAVLQNNQIKIKTTPNQDNPLMDAGKEPEMMPKILFGIDLWEHAYYLKYQNKRADYVANFWKVINWEVVEERIKN